MSAALKQSLTVQSTALGVLAAVLVLWAPELGLGPYLEKALQTIGIFAGAGGVVGLRRAIGWPGAQLSPTTATLIQPGQGDEP